MPKVVPRFGTRVSRGLTRHGWSQRELARRAGEDVSLSTVQAATAGIVPGPEKVLAIALAMGEDPNRLLGAAGWPFRYDPQVIADADAESDHRPLSAGLRPVAA